MRFNEKVLMFESCAEFSPRVRAKRIAEVEVVRGKAGDEIELEVILNDGTSFSVRTTFGERTPLAFADGVVSARRVSGDGPITVILFQE